jgi:hypothetical protein
MQSHRAVHAGASAPIYGETSITNFEAPPDSVKSLSIKDFMPWIVGVLGVFVTLYSTLYSVVYYPHRVKRLEMRLKFVEDQLERFYGPLLAECIASDSVFRRVELALKYLQPGHRHNNIRELTVDCFPPASGFGDRTSTTNNYKSSDPPTPQQLFATFISKVYLPLNQKRADLIKHNLHLIGPYPPVSLNLFLNHAAQFESIIAIKREIDILLPPLETLTRYDDPYILMPYPMMLTAEVVAKVALLKAVQNEHRYRHGRAAFFLPREVFIRKQYFLILNPGLRQLLNEDTDTRPEQEQVDYPRQKNQQAFNPASFPLIWGPYSPVELFELRSWLISRYQAVAALKKSLPAETRVIEAMLKAKIAFSSRKGIDYPLHYRVAQLFDELDIPGSKFNHPWDPKFDWHKLEEDPALGTYRLYRMKTLKGECTLNNIPKAPGFAYYERRYKKMRDVDRNA